MQQSFVEALVRVLIFHILAHDSNRHLSHRVVDALNQTPPLGQITLTLG